MQTSTGKESEAKRNMEPLQISSSTTDATHTCYITLTTDTQRRRGEAMTTTGGEDQSGLREPLN